MRTISESQLKKLQALNDQLEITVKTLYDCIDNKDNTLFKLNYSNYCTQKSKWEMAAKCGYKNPEISEYAKSIGIE